MRIACCSGICPGIEFPHEFLPQPGDRFWTPADWAWAGGLLNVLLPGLHYGVPVVAARFEKFDPEEAFALMARMEVRNAFIPPTALRMLRSAPQPARASRPPAALGRLRRRGARRRDAGMGPGRARARDQRVLRPDRMQSRGRVLRGDRRVEAGRDRQAGAGPYRRGDPPGRLGLRAPARLGQIAIRRPDPVMFLEYWGKPDATREKFIGDWMTTGDQGVIDEDGYVQFIGRDDDVITSSGYRIGPTEIEDCLIRHPAVALAAAVGKPDPMRTEIVKAFIVLKAGYAPSDAPRRRDPGVREDAAVGARISARGRLHRADADDDHRQGDPPACCASRPEAAHEIAARQFRLQAQARYVAFFTPACTRRSRWSELIALSSC